MSRRTTAAAVLLATAAALTACSHEAPADGGAPAGATPPSKHAVAIGRGGAVSSVNPYASKVGLDILRHGGNAVDAAVGTAAALGVVEPYSAGIGGGGYLVRYDARTHRVDTVDGRETAPSRMRADSFTDPGTGEPMDPSEAMDSGLSVGVPGTVKTWQEALKRWGTLSFAKAVEPSAALADKGFVVNEEFRAQTEMNEKRFRAVDPTRELFLPGGRLPAVGSTFRNPDLARTYRLLAQQGPDTLYTGRLARDIVHTVQHPPAAEGHEGTVTPGLMRLGDLDSYTAPTRRPVHSTYHGLDLYGMGPSTSGGIAVGEALNILKRFSVSNGDKAQALHHYLEASRIAFADRNRWVGDPSTVHVPSDKMLSRFFAKDRACLINPHRALNSPLAPGDPNHSDHACSAGKGARQPHEGTSTTHLVTSDRWGNVVSYTLTIEQTGGSAITVPDRGFLLNNELTDFDFVPVSPGTYDPNLPGPGKRPRSSMSPTIILKNGKPCLTVGSPGGATIITTVLQTLVNRLDLGMSLPQAIAAPRASQRNAAQTEAEPDFLALPERKALERLGHSFVPAPRTFTPRPEIGAATGIEFRPDGTVLAAAEPVRRGGGSAMVVDPVH
ncbi:gamma-glutamyltransferase [Wenjunlia tyrosinilytica]|uniref:gamma-glutamyltransferase n=1 Tax=Wenjunlia tyrosinilytica TaxID=1544741 RepID=UPI001E40873C|nr:gamma-glutamyltransferase [Wenjunlia tyrosinilytica]